MGDPKHVKKKYSKPIQAWKLERLEAEKPIVSEYGLKNKRELWRVDFLLRKFTGQAKRLIPLSDAQSSVEKKQILSRLASLGLVGDTASLDDVLGLTVKDFLGRRLQTLVFKRNLSRSVSQARQFIVHRHIAVNGRVVTSPSFFVPVAVEGTIAFVESSALAKPEHPERVVEKPKEVSAENGK